MLPRVAREELQRVDAKLAAIPLLSELTDDQLVGVLRRTRALLVSIHGHEVLAGTLLSAEDRPLTGAGLALAAVASGQEQGWSDGQIIARSPVALAILAPRIGRARSLPDIPRRTDEPGHVVDLSAREGLRLRARWAQELTVRTAQELGDRLHAAGRLPSPASVAWLRLDQLEQLVSAPEAGPPVVAPAEPGAPLPAAFKLTESGAIAAVARPGVPTDGRGAGGGRGEGPVAHGTPDQPPPDGSVLVVRTLEPELAAVLPGLAGLVAETGSTLSHLAILAREYGVPTVVAVPDALERYPEGAVVLVDGGTGEVKAVDGSGPAGRPRDDGGRSDQPEREVIS
jgi:pyruvate,water dikinase